MDNVYFSEVGVIVRSAFPNNSVVTLLNSNCMPMALDLFKRIGDTFGCGIFSNHEGGRLWITEVG
jgi:hypothetical protein